MFLSMKKTDPEGVTYVLLKVLKKNFLFNGQSLKKLTKYMYDNELIARS